MIFSADNANLPTTSNLLLTAVLGVPAPRWILIDKKKIVRDNKQRQIPW